MSLIRLVLLSGLLHAYVGWRLLPDLPGPAGWAIAVGVLLAINAALMPMVLLARRIHARRRSDGLAWAGGIAMGLFSSLFVFSLLRDALLLVADGLAWVFTALPAFPGFAALTTLSALPTLSISGLVGYSAAAVPLLALAATVAGFVNARRTAPVVTVEVPIEGLAPALHGFTIAQLSDIHVGATIKRRYLHRIVDSVNRIGADMVAVTGDLVDGSVPELGAHVGALAGLASRHGTFFVTGNHEYYSGAVSWVRELRRIGLHVLMNEHVVLRHDGAALVIAGVTDFGAHHFDATQRSDPGAAMAGAPADTTSVLLAHQPRSADAAERAGFDLQLSGHTHGGQFWPWVHFVRLQQPFTAGLHRLRRLWVYTSRGTGYWGPPNRFGASPEITRLRLVPVPV